MRSNCPLGLGSQSARQPYDASVISSQARMPSLSGPPDMNALAMSKIITGPRGWCRGSAIAAPRRTCKRAWATNLASRGRTGSKPPLEFHWRHNPTCSSRSTMLSNVSAFRVRSQAAAQASSSSSTRDSGRPRTAVSSARITDFTPGQAVSESGPDGVSAEVDSAFSRTSLSRRCQFGAFQSSESAGNPGCTSRHPHECRLMRVVGSTTLLCACDGWSARATRAPTAAMPKALGIWRTEVRAGLAVWAIWKSSKPITATS